MSNLSWKIEPLGKNNFEAWRIQIEALLIKNDSWNYVNGKKKRPSKIEGDLERDNQIEEWEEADTKARADLILSIKTSELQQFKGLDTSNAVWKKVHEIYRSYGPARKVMLLKELLYIKMKNGTSIRDHVNRFMELKDQLCEIGMQINDEILVILLLCSLPESYEVFKCAMESRDDLPSLDRLQVKLLEEFQARKDKTDTYDSEAMYVGKKFYKRRDEINIQIDKKKFLH